MQNWTVELIGTNHEDVENTKEHKAKKNAPSRVTKNNSDNTTSSPGTYQMLPAKSSMDVPGL